MTSTEANPKRRLQRRSWVTLVLLLSAILLLASTGWTVLRTASLWRATQRVSRRASILFSAPPDTDHALEAATMLCDLERIQSDLDALRGAFGGVLGPLARQSLWPWLSVRATVLHEGLSMASELTETAWWVALRIQSSYDLHGTINTAAGVPIEMRADPLAAVARALRERRSSLLTARASASQWKTAASELDTASLRRYAGLPSLLIDGLLILPEALAEGESRRYLVLIQNNDELRATGGFISSLAVIDLDGYRLAAIRYMNSYDVEAYHAVHPLPPQALQRYMQAGVLLFRDGNWSPDFPTTAEVLASLYLLDMGEAVNGVVAIDSVLVQWVLEALGPIHIPDYDVTVTAENVLDVAVTFWEHPLDAPSITQRHESFQAWLERRKDFGGALVKAGAARLGTLTPGDLARLAVALQRAVEEKHLLAWAIDHPRLQARLRDAGMDGAVRFWPGDYLMVVDSNVGWNKVDRNIDRRIAYRVRAEGDALIARLCITYQNVSPPTGEPCVWRSLYADSYRELTADCYWNHVRVLTPKGSELLGQDGGQGDLAVGQEAGKTLFADLVIVPPGESRTLCFDYALPTELGRRLVEQGDYALYVQKQPGTLAVPLTLDLLPGMDSCAIVQPRAMPRDAPITNLMHRDHQITISCQ
jgi:hypothetical protein